MVSGGFPARTSALPEPEPESTEREADSGARWPGSLAKYDPDTCSWKTAQRSLLGDSEPSLVTWPRSGLMLDGQCWELPTLERRTDVSASGFWQNARRRRRSESAGWKVEQSRGAELSAQVLYPTPCANSHTGAGHGPNKKGAPNLQTVVACMTWPTPRASDHKGATSAEAAGKAIQLGHSPNLPEQIAAVEGRKWPTATATAFNGWSPNHNRANTDDRLDYTVERGGFPAWPADPADAVESRLDRVANGVAHRTHRS